MSSIEEYDIIKIQSDAEMQEREARETVKHNGLIRILSVLMAVISLSLLVSGIYGMYMAARDRNRENTELERIRDTADEYRSVLAQRMDPEEYEDLSRSMEARQNTYDSDMTKHRKDLAAFTAARGALETAEETLARSETALQTAKSQYESGKKTMELLDKTVTKLYDQMMEAKPLLDEGTTLLAQMLQAVQNLKGSLSVLDTLGTLSDVTASEEELAELRQQTALAAYDAAITAYEGSVVLVGMLQDREIPISQLKQAMGLTDDASVQELKKALAEVGIVLTAVQTQALEGDSIVLLSSQQVEELKQSIESAAGMSMEEMLAAMKSERNAIANGEDGLSDEEFDAIRNTFTNNLAAIQNTSAAIAAAMPELEETLINAQNKLNDLNNMVNSLIKEKGELDKSKAALQQAALQVVQGEQALEQGKKQLKEQQDKLDEQARVLEKEKLRLDEEELALKEMNEKLGEQKDLEDRERSLRMSLLADSEIKEKTETGTELLTAAEERIDAFGERLRLVYGSRFAGCMAMLTAVVLAFLSAAAAFREEESRKIFLVSDILCIVCCAAAVCAFYVSGRGLSYSALTTGCTAAAVLAASFVLHRQNRGKVYN